MQYKVTYRDNQIKGEVDLPKSKSISNRLMILSALSGGKVSVKQPSASDDTQIMQNLIQTNDGTKDAGHAGTVMRFLTSYFAVKGRNITLTGSERMKQRPIGELVKCLNEIGAGIEYKEKEGYPPLYIPGNKLISKRLNIDSGISSQFISSLLMIAPYINSGLELELTGKRISNSYIEMTIRLMEMAGARISFNHNIICVEEGKYRQMEVEAEPDWSAASYWFMMAGLAESSDVLLKGLKKESLQGDAKLTEIFSRLGVISDFEEKGLRLKKGSIPHDTFRYNFIENPDVVQSVVPYCIFQGIPFDIEGCISLKIKETDRISALYKELLKFGVEISFSADGDKLSWDGSSVPDIQSCQSISTYSDHRMAMSFAPLCLKSGSIIIEDPMVVTKSYPSYWDDLRDLGFKIRGNHSD